MSRDSDVLVIGGFHDVRIALQQRAGEVKSLWYDARRRDRRLTEVLTLAEKQGVTVSAVERTALDERARGLRHQGILAQCVAGALAGESGLATLVANLDHDPLLLVLDGIQDPHNLGACLRSADGAGVDAVVVPSDRACGMTPTVSRVAAGAAHHVPLFAVSNLGRTLESLKGQGVWLVAAADDAEVDLWQADFSGPLALVCGAEGGGLRQLTRRLCDRDVAIPMSGVCESLNVSVAVGVLLYEARRQRSR